MKNLLDQGARGAVTARHSGKRHSSGGLLELHSAQNPAPLDGPMNLAGFVSVEFRDQIARGNPEVYAR